ncbi:MAG: hypothetical protein NTY33_04600 [Candidatus Moranbacteria bacterium]|nr:hypothetical protein [Candidatus Moranbacteria bacterium]
MNNFFARRVLKKPKPSKIVVDERPSAEETIPDKERELVPTREGAGELNVKMAAISTHTACGEMGFASRSKGFSQLSAEYRRGDGRRRQ